MNANLRLNKPTRTYRWLRSLLVALPFIFGSVSEINAQCAGPYQYFESVPAGYASPVATGLAANGWLNNVTGVSSVVSPNNHSGLRAVTMTNATRYVQSPVLSNPGVFSFWFKATLAAGYNFRVEHSTDINMTSPAPTLLGNYVAAGAIGWTKVTIDLAAAGVPANSHVRISSNSTATMFFDSFAHISSDPTQNTIIVPDTGAAVSCTVPLTSGMTYTFYDNGGQYDNYTTSQNTNITFDPAPGEQVELTFTSFLTGTTGSMTLTGTVNPLTPSPYSGNVLPSPVTYLGTTADSNVLANFTSTTGGVQPGYIITVKSIPPVATCSDPTAVNVPAGAIQANQANVTFTPPASVPSNGYQYYYSTTNTAPTGATTPTGTGASSPIAMTGLASNTQYWVWVRSDCGGLYGNWVAGPTFTTKCSAYPLPYSEDFNGLNGPLPTCTSSDTSNAYYTNIINGNLFTAFEGATFFTKPVALVGGTTYRLTFDYGTINGVADFDVNYGMTNFTPTTGNINILLNMYSGVSTLSSGVYNFTPAASGTYYVGFTLQAVGNPGSTQFNLDNINIEAETCFPPTAVDVPFATITASSAIANWTAPAIAPSNGYQYYISTSSAPPDYSTPPTGTATGTSTNLGPLTSGTTYYIWVRSNCAGRYSVWSALDSFTTTVVTVQTVNMSTGITNMNCNDIYNFFDSGGSAASYVDYEDLTRTFVPGFGKKVKVVFTSFSTESNWDGLSIYNGNSTAAPLISSGLPAGFNATTAPAGSYYGTTSPGTIISTAADGSLTFNFKSDFIIVRPGWSATVTCVTAPTIASFTPADNNCGIPTVPLTITGTNFSGAGVPAITGVFFNGVPVASGQWTVLSPTQIRVDAIPAGITTGFITVSNTEATASSATAYIVNPPRPTTTGVTICQGGTGTLTTASICTGYNQVAANITGNLNAATDPTAPRPSTSTANSTNCAFAAVTSNYTSVQFQVSATGLYNLELSATPAFDAMGYITTGAFTPGSCATGTYIIGDDDSGVGTFPRLSVNLVAGVTYTLWTTVWSGSNTTYTGAFSWAVSSPGGGTALLYSNAQMEWYTAPTGGTAIGTGSPFNPVGVAGSGLPDTNTPGTYTFYAGCSSNPTCRTATTFVINPNAVAGTVSADQTICSGSSPANITLTGSTGTIQWQSSPDNSTWTNIAGATATPLTSAQMGPLTAVRYYRAVLTATCSTLNSAVVTVNVNPTSVAGTVTPATTAVCSGTNSTLLTLAGNTGTIQWQSSPDNVTFTNIAGQTASTYTATNLSATTYYRAVVTSGVCPPANTTSVVITVSTPSVAGSVTPATTTVCAGTNSTVLTLAGNTGTIQWQSSPDNSTWTNIALATNPTYTATNLGTTTYYRAVVTNGACVAQNTASVVVTVNPAAVAGTASASQTICAGAQPANMTLAGYTGTIQWQSSPDNSTWTNVAGATAATLTGATVGPLAATTYFRAVVTSGVCTPVNSNVLTITVTPVNGGTVSPAAQGSCTTLSNLTVAGFTGTVSSWEWATDAAFTTPNTIPSSNSPTLTTAQIGVFTGTRYYRALVTSGSCPAYSSVASVSFSVTTWNGSWDNGVPNATTGAVFASNYTATANLSACSVQILSGANVVVNPGIVLTVQNEVVVNAGGSLTFENTSSLIQVNDAASNSGFVTYKRTTTPMHMFDYTYWSSPLSPQTLFGVSPGTLSDKYFQFNTASNTYQQLPSNSIMVPGKGYIIRAPQGYPVSPAAPIPYTAVFNGGSGDGVPNNGVITIPSIVSGANVMNLLGNPYASALVADAFLTTNSSLIDGTVYLWTHNTPINSNQYTGSDYAVYNLGGGTGTAAATNPGINNQVPNGFIGAGQGFFVKAIANGTLTYNNSMRSGNNTQFFRPAVGASSPGGLEKNRVWLELKNDLGAYKQAMVGYIETATNQRDWGFDSDMVDAGNVVNLYSIQDADKYVIQGRALPFDVLDQVPLGAKFNFAGTYEINLSTFDGFFSHQEIYLEDKLLNVIHNLKSGSYSFVTESGVFDERFVLRYTTEGTALGVGEQFSENTVLVYKENAGITINTSNVVMASVKIFDVRGRLIAEKKDIGTNTYHFENLPETQQVLLVKIISTDGAVVTKKLVF